MPSHSSSTGSISGGGHVGGGGSFGGSHMGDGFGAERPPRRPRGPVYMPFFGRTVIFTPGIRSAFSVGIFFLVFALIAIFALSGVVVNSNSMIRKYNERINVLTEQSKGYVDLIEKANAGTDNYGIVTATFDDEVHTYWDYEIDDDDTGVYQYHAVSNYANTVRYFIRYKFVIDGKTAYGETYAKYQYSDIAVFSKTGGKRTIQIAYHKLSSADKMIDNEGPDSNASQYGFDCINADFVGFEGDAPNSNSDIFFEYGEAKFCLENSQSNYKTYRGVLIGVGCVAVLIITIIVVAFVCRVKKSKKELEEQKAKEEKLEKLEEEQRVEKKKQLYCKYCGVRVSPEETKCPNCGSSMFEKK